MWLAVHSVKGDVTLNCGCRIIGNRRRVVTSLYTVSCSNSISKRIDMYLETWQKCSQSIGCSVIFTDVWKRTENTEGSFASCGSLIGLNTLCRPTFIRHHKNDSIKTERRQRRQRRHINDTCYVVKMVVLRTLKTKTYHGESLCWCHCLVNKIVPARSLRQCGRVRCHLGRGERTNVINIIIIALNSNYTVGHVGGNMEREGCGICGERRRWSLLLLAVFENTFSKFKKRYFCLFWNGMPKH